MNFKKVIDLTKSVIRRFEKIEGKPWGVNGTMIELSKQVGDLSKLVMTNEGYYPKGRGKEDRQYEATKEKIADELSDIFFMVIRLSVYYRIDLEKAHIKALNSASKYLKSHGV